MVILQTMGMAPPLELPTYCESKNRDRARRKFGQLSSQISSRDNEPGSLQSSQNMPSNAKKTHRELNALFCWQFTAGSTDFLDGLWSL